MTSKSSDEDLATLLEQYGTASLSTTSTAPLRPAPLVPWDLVKHLLAMMELAQWRRMTLRRWTCFFPITCPCWPWWAALRSTSAVATAPFFGLVDTVVALACSNDFAGLVGNRVVIHLDEPDSAAEVPPSAAAGAGA